jgi:hypothetical protein
VLLPILGTPAEQDEYHAGPAREVHAVAWAVVNAHLHDTASNGPAVAKIATLRGTNPMNDPCLPAWILEPGQPPIEDRGADDRVHDTTVSIWIQSHCHLFVNSKKALEPL